MCSVGGTGQTSLFGNNQNKLGATLGSIGTFGGTGFNTGSNSLGFGTTQQPVGKTDQSISTGRLRGFVCFFSPAKKYLSDIISYSL